MKFIIWTALVVSVILVLIPIAMGIVRRILHFIQKAPSQSTFLNVKFWLLPCLFLSIFALRFAVGYYTVFYPLDGMESLTAPETVLDSFVHALQTFSMDEDYTQYVQNGKTMIGLIADKNGAFWSAAYGIYASILNVAAPVVGGAFILDILTNMFPKIRLFFGYVFFWRKKYYFSELNDRSLALAKSIYENKRSFFSRPLIVFTDTYVDSGDERSSERYSEARSYGAICLRDDIVFLWKARLGKKKYFLIDDEEIGNLQTLTSLYTEKNKIYLKNAKIYLFSQDDVYTQIIDRLKDTLDFGSEAQKPMIIPIQTYRNLMSNLFVKIPLYEPLLHKRKNASGTVDLNVTILGTGLIGTETFLSVYWFGQMLGCKLHINVISKESEKMFRSRIDYLNPEILQSGVQNSPILSVRKNKPKNDPYFSLKYLEADVQEYNFDTLLKSGTHDGQSIFDTDYFIVALGSDADNLSVANQLQKYIGTYHLTQRSEQKTVITYAVYDAELSETLNRKKIFSYTSLSRADVYMHAFGSLSEVYSTENIFMEEFAEKVDHVEESYQSIVETRKREVLKKQYFRRRKSDEDRYKDDYSYWGDLSRAMHIHYKMFSAGFIPMSLFDGDEKACEGHMREAEQKYKTFVCDEANDSAVLHALSWLEHRRWNAFMRIRGFRSTDKFDLYYEKTGSHKHLDLKLHPCLVECDQAGIRTGADPDRLDELTAYMQNKKKDHYNFKTADYPKYDFKS